jgi:hypothetical protein
MIAPVQFIVAQMGVTLGDGNIAMARQFLCQLQVSGSQQHGSDEIMAERVGGNRPHCIFAQGFLHALVDNILTCACSYGFDLLAGAAVVTGEEGQRKKQSFNYHLLFPKHLCELFLIHPDIFSHRL